MVPSCKIAPNYERVLCILRSVCWLKHALKNLHDLWSAININIVTIPPSVNTTTTMTPKNTANEGLTCPSGPCNWLGGELCNLREENRTCLWAHHAPGHGHGHGHGMVIALWTLRKVSETGGAEIGAEQASSPSAAGPRFSWVTVKLRATTFFRLDAFFATF